MEALIDIILNPSILHIQVRDQTKFPLKDKLFESYMIPAIKKKKGLLTFDFSNCGLSENLSTHTLDALALHDTLMYAHLFTKLTPNRKVIANKNILGEEGSKSLVNLINRSPKLEVAEAAHSLLNVEIVHQAILRVDAKGINNFFYTLTFYAGSQMKSSIEAGNFWPEVHGKEMAQEKGRTKWSFSEHGKKISPSKLAVLIKSLETNPHVSTWDNKDGFSLDVSNSNMKFDFSSMEECLSVRHSFAFWHLTDPRFQLN